MDRIAITITTINKPFILENLYNQDISDMKILVVVMGDKKSPSGNSDYCKQFNKDNFETIYMTTEQQFQYFSRFSDLLNHIPLNSFSRRNFADLYALIKDCDYIIKIDDDNFPIDDQFIIGHVKSLKNTKINKVSSSSGWLNVCDVLVDSSQIPFYPRGFPYSARWQNVEVKQKPSHVSVGVNAGLWVGDPDIDAITRLAYPIKAEKFDSKKFGSSFVLEKDTWAPINTQNTGFTREACSISFVSPFVGRFDDIFSGYIIRKILDHLGISVSYGIPIVDQKRNLHNIWNDEFLERFGNTKGELFILELKSIQLRGQDVYICYQEVIDYFVNSRFFQEFELRQMLLGMQIWLNSVRTI